MVHMAAGYARQRTGWRLGVHHLDRARRDQHDHRRGARDGQPAAGAAAAGRHLRHASPAPGAPAARGAARRHRLGERRLPARVALLRPRRAPRAGGVRGARGDARAHRPAETGAVTLALPEDVQAEAVEVPESFLEPRVGRSGAGPPAPDALARAAELMRAAKRPLIVGGGGVIYSEATEALRRLGRGHRHPRRRDAGRPRLARSDHPLALGAVGATGTFAANRLAREADLVIGVGTRWSDFTTASKSAFQDPDVRFVNLNVTEFDAAKQSGLPLVCDARLGLERCARPAEAPRATGLDRRQRGRRRSRAGRRGGRGSEASAPSRRTAAAEPGRGHRRDQRRGRRDGVVVCAAGSAPGDLHKLWRARDPKSYHVEYGYSCMGYEIPGAIGVKLAAPDRDVFVHGRRRLLPDAPGRARDRGGREHQDRGRAGGQPRLRVDRRAVALARLGRLRHPLPAQGGAPAARRAERRGRRSRPTHCPWTSRRMPRASARG